MTNCPKVFITAAGSSRRFGGTVLKQLLPVNHEPIIRRTIRQVRETSPDSEVYILTWHPQLFFHDVQTIHTHTRPPELADTILLSERYWGSRNVVLMGDVVFSDDAIRRVFEGAGAGGVKVYARVGTVVKSNSERFALTFDSDHAAFVRSLLARASSEFSIEGREGSSGMRKICSAAKPGFLFPFCTDKVYGFVLFPLFRPFRDFLFFHVINECAWIPWPPVELVLLDDDPITTDIDNWQEYFAFIRSGVL